MKPTEAFERVLATNVAAIADADSELADVLERFGFEPMALITHRAEEDQVGAWMMHRLASLGVEVSSADDLRVILAATETITAYAAADGVISPLLTLRAVALLNRVSCRRLTR